MVPCPSRTPFRRFSRRVTIVVLAACFSGCAYASAPVKSTPQVAATPVDGELTVAVDKSAPVGDVVPVYVSVANGTDIARAVVPSQVFAINDAGERVAPLPAGEAARQAGGAGELKAALASGAVGTAAGGAMGAASGAAVGALSGGIGPGALIGAAIGGVTGALGGAWNGQKRADDVANAQIQSIALQPQDANHGFTVSGYVFFPKGDYREIDVLMINRETGDTEVIKRPWP
jgi:hypothetical protein